MVLKSGLKKQHSVAFCLQKVTAIVRWDDGPKSEGWNYKGNYMVEIQERAPSHLQI